MRPAQPENNALVDVLRNWKGDFRNLMPKLGIEFPSNRRLSCARVFLKFLLATFLLMIAGCGTMLQRYGYGRVAPADVAPQEEVIRVYLPENGPSISQRYRPKSDQARPGATENVHEGIDIFAQPGTPIIAPAAGKVVGSDWTIMYGNRIMIDHGNDENGRHIVSRYLHLQKRLAMEGDRVIRGQQIGALGRTGVLAGYPHLHFEIKRLIQSDQWTLEKSLNPHIYWMNGIGRVTCFDRNQKWPDHPLKMTYPVPCRGLQWQ